MRSTIFQQHGMPDADYDFEVGTHAAFNIPCVNFLAPGHGLQQIDLTGASQIKQKFDVAGDKEAAGLFDRLIKQAQGGSSDLTTKPLYVDASRTAQLDHGAETAKFYSLQEARLAWDRLPESRKEIAQITSARHVYQRNAIERFYYQRQA